jgi:serine/threonine protein phosphatase PrpC
MRFQVGFQTDIGRKRQQNQDNGAALPEHGVFLVADGMGGHRGGETASAIAVEVIPTVLNRELSIGRAPSDSMTTAIQTASRSIHAKASENPTLQGMGTTSTVLLFKDGKLTIGHVGDSRAYLLRKDCIWQLTRDHSLVQEKLRAGLINREQVRSDRMKNVITRSVGFEKDVEVDTYEMDVAPGDRFLICSDGLSGLLEDNDLLQVVESSTLKDGQSSTLGTSQTAVAELIRTANQRGGDDNITAILVEVLPEALTPPGENP